MEDFDFLLIWENLLKEGDDVLLLNFEGVDDECLAHAWDLY